MPRKVFVAGEVLTAADVNTNLADQAVMTFAGTAARGSAIGTAVEGMVTYLEDTDQLEVYGGTAVGWTSASNFLFGTATPTDGQVVSYSTAVSGYVPADAPSGKVLQVVSTTKDNSFSTTSSSFVDVTGMSATITPSSASNKILVLLNMATSTSDTSGAADAGFVLVRNTTEIAKSTAGGTYNFTGHSTNRFGIGAIGTNGMSVSHLDSPATTSAVTYKVQVNTQGGTFYVNLDGGAVRGSVSTITLMEIAG